MLLGTLGAIFVDFVV